MNKFSRAGIISGPELSRARLEEGKKAGSLRLPRILLLDDESEIVDLCANVLKRHYLVVKTSSPFEAVSFMDAGRQMIDLVICDYSMPGMNGTEFVDKIRANGIKTPVILYSGMIASRASREFDKFVKVLEKPFGGDKLMAEVSSVLEEIRRESDGHEKLQGIVPHLDASIERLEVFLRGRGLDLPLDGSPSRAIEKLGEGEAYNVFLSWHYLNEARMKISR